MPTQKSEEYYTDLLGNDEVIGRFGRNVSALVLPALNWQVITPPVTVDSPTEVWRGIMIFADDEGFYDVTIRQLDGTDVIMRLRPSIVYPFFIAGVITATEGITVMLAK